MRGLMVIVALLLAAAAGADTVVVKPGDLHGWVPVTQTTSCNESPVGDFRMAGPGTAPAGTGSFHFFTHPWDPCDLTPEPTPYALEKIYLGTNNHSGVRLDEITSFRYYTYVHSRHFGPSGQPNGQPPEIELITDITNAGEEVWQQRVFVYKPWGWAGNHHVQKDAWDEWDLMQTGEPHNHWELLDNYTTNCRGDWDWVVARYPEGTEEGHETSPHCLATPAVGDFTEGYTRPGPPPVTDWRYANQSGTSISIKVGSGKTWSMLNQNPPCAFWDPDTQSWLTEWAWWRESCGIDAYADRLVIGINGVETVYDFERGTALTVGIKPSVSYDAINGIAKDNFFFVAFGKVAGDPWGPTGTEFYLEDGTAGKMIKVVAQNGAEAGQYLRAKGTLEYDSSTQRYDLYSTVYDVTLLE
jgi:hypothetical protein